MAVAEADREMPRDASERRFLFAVDWLQAMFRQKHGNAKAHGEATVTVHWRSGEIELVTVSDGTTYR